MDRNEHFTLAALAERSATPSRTIRFYIARGLLDGPQTAGRAAHYTVVHLERLRLIKKLQQDGMMLAEIAAHLAGRPTRGLQPEPWLHYTLAGDVKVMVREGGSPWRVKLIRQALADLGQKLRQQEGDNNDE